MQNTERDFLVVGQVSNVIYMYDAYTELLLKKYNIIQNILIKSRCSCKNIVTNHFVKRTDTTRYELEIKKYFNR